MASLSASLRCDWRPTNVASSSELMQKRNALLQVTEKDQLALPHTKGT
jgi:hypothetical protein